MSVSGSPFFTCPACAHYVDESHKVWEEDNSRCTYWYDPDEISDEAPEDCYTPMEEKTT